MLVWSTLSSCDGDTEVQRGAAKTTPQVPSRASPTSPGSRGPVSFSERSSERKSCGIREVGTVGRWLGCLGPWQQQFVCVLGGGVESDVNGPLCLQGLRPGWAGAPVSWLGGLGPSWGRPRPLGQEGDDWVG